MTQGRRIALIAAVVVLAIVAFIVLKPDDKKSSTSSNAGSTTQTTATTTPGKPSKPAPPPVTEINVQGGKPVGGVKTIEVNKGDQVRFSVSSDVSDEIHVHGYD